MDAMTARLLDALILAMDALPDSETAGPTGTGYRWAWDELTGAEQEWVKEQRNKVAALVLSEDGSLTDLRTRLQG